MYKPIGRTEIFRRTQMLERFHRSRGGYMRKGVATRDNSSKLVAHSPPWKHYGRPLRAFQDMVLRRQ